MFRLELGGGAVAFENEGEADRVASVRLNELVQRNWPPEVIENIRQYQKHLGHPETASELDITTLPAAIVAEEITDTEELAEAAESPTFGESQSEL
ncbi:MAG: hypothetical protein K2X57_28350 [Xanthobacteraceae bacterium]|nr:hypothetical protein [Xanthobacteraceae bacterium]